MMVNGIIKLNLGCGSDYKKDWINIDVNKGVKADKYFDFNKMPYPFKENSIDHIQCKQVIEHLNINFFDFLKECARIMKPNGTMHLETPNAYFWRNRIKFLFGRMNGSFWSPHHTKLVHPFWLEESMKSLGFGIEKYHKGVFFLPRSLSESNLEYNLRKRN